MSHQPPNRHVKMLQGLGLGHEDLTAWEQRAILEALVLRPEDRLLEIGCGGGLLLRDALTCGVESATGLDHSEEMVSLARERAPGAEIVVGRAEQLPFADASFTAVAMSIVFFFLSDPVAILRECGRVVAPAGRLALYTTSPQLRGTPAAPEPIASLGNFYGDEELAALGREAGLADVLVANDGGGQLVTGSA